MVGSTSSTGEGVSGSLVGWLWGARDGWVSGVGGVTGAAVGSVSSTGVGVGGLSGVVWGVASTGAAVGRVAGSADSSTGDGVGAVLGSASSSTGAAVGCASGEGSSEGVGEGWSLGSPPAVVGLGRCRHKNSKARIERGKDFLKVIPRVCRVRNGNKSDHPARVAPMVPPSRSAISIIAQLNTAALLLTPSAGTNSTGIVYGKGRGDLGVFYGHTSKRMIIARESVICFCQSLASWYYP